MGRYIDMTGWNMWEHGQPRSVLIVLSRDTDQYDYAPWECECECGVTTIVASRELLSGETRSCGCKKSLGEARIAKYLQEHDIKFQREYTFSDLPSVMDWKLCFDFAIFKDNQLLCLIEFQGKQHYEPIDGFGGEAAFEIGQQNDRAKEEYCKKIISNYILYHTKKIQDKDLKKYLEV